MKRDRRTMCAVYLDSKRRPLGMVLDEHAGTDRPKDGCWLARLSRGTIIVTRR